MFLGLAILLVGVLFLLKNLGYISSNVWEVIWPCLVVVLGLAMIFRRKKDLWSGKK